MEFYEFTEEIKAFPGEYIFHAPTHQIVLCGAFSRENNTIRVLARGKMFTDNIHNFKKIKIEKGEKTKRRISTCRDCKK
jgi:hypothetical protein